MASENNVLVNDAYDLLKRALPAHGEAVASLRQDHQSTSRRFSATR
jgi:hypothetical protein